MQGLSFILLMLGVLALEEQEMNFLIVGDFGDIQKMWEADKTFDTINEFSAENQFDFFLSLGDNVYYYGIQSPDDKKFQKMYSLFKRDNIKHKDVFGTLGNHDCYGNPQAQVDVSKKSDNNWLMDDLYYSRVWDLDGNEENGKEFGLLVLDGCQLCCYSTAPQSQCKKIKVPSDKVIEKHYTWIEDELERMKSEGVIWTAMSIHWPIWSAAHDHHDTELLQTKLFKTLAKYKVDFFFAGHTHTMQYTNWPYDKELKYRKPQTDTKTCSMNKEINVDDTREQTFKKGDYIHQFILGASGKHRLTKLCTDYKKRSTGHLKYASNKHHSFANVRVSSDAVTVTAYERDDSKDSGKSYKEIYRVTVEQ